MQLGQQDAGATTRETAPSEAKETAQSTQEASEEVLWDLSILKDLLELEESGAGVTWPEGLNRMDAQRLIKKGERSQNAKGIGQKQLSAL